MGMVIASLATLVCGASRVPLVFGLYCQRATTMLALTMGLGVWRLFVAGPMLAESSNLSLACLADGKESAIAGLLDRRIGANLFSGDYRAAVVTAARSPRRISRWIMRDSAGASTAP
ncbi:hypothetical protein D5045_19665 [Verminephrobacter eiseniae]|uniref:hypothetical protein n=1 Tax=Verminephrobacter eiseniae TaxID=364317 RepID=UPI002237C20B|nr:hypothetical protein [Verminephrobacter eiseniae]MCW5262286.1 hypothetical protein [Verminephrobacter eiseniae]